MRFLKYNGLILYFKDQEYILISSKVRKLENQLKAMKVIKLGLFLYIKKKKMKD